MRKLDALVAEKVMGMPRAIVDALALGPPAYSTSIADAWDVVEKLDTPGPFWTIESPRGVMDDTKWSAHYIPVPTKFGGSGRLGVGEADSAPLAICIAALKAVGVSEAEIQEAMN